MEFFVGHVFTNHLFNRFEHSCKNFTETRQIQNSPVEHNYISPSSAVRIQLHVSALYVGHLQVVI